MEEEFKKYPKIRTLGHKENEDIFKDKDDEIIIEEKIDGGNFRFMIKDGKIIFGSRTQELGDVELESKNLKNFRRCINYVQQQLQDKDLQLLESRMFYGECCIKHTLPYDFDLIPPFLGFDVYCFEHEKFLRNKHILYEAIGLECVPLLDIVKASDIKTVTDDDVPITKYPPKAKPDLKAEGIVFKNYSKQIFAKYVREQFKEANNEVFGGTVKYEETDDGKIVAKYCTNARIDKLIFKLIDEGEELDLSMMKVLPTRVYTDICEEHWEDLLIGKYKYVIDVKNIRRLITKRCIAVLKQVITNNALNQ